MSKLQIEVSELSGGIRMDLKKKYEQNIRLLYLLELLMSIHFFGSVMIPFFQDWGGISFAQVMILESIFTGAIFLLEVPTGTMADKFGRKLSLNLAFITNTVAVLVYVSYPNFYVFALGEIIWALAAALTSGAHEAMIYDSLIELGREKESKKTFSRLKTVGLSGMVLGSISGGLIASKWGVRSTMTLSAIPLILSFVIGLFLVEPTIRKSAEKDSPIQIFRNGLKTIKNSHQLRKLIADMIVLSVIAYYSIWLWQGRLLNLNVNIAYFGLIHAGMIIGQILLLNSIIPLEKLLRSKKGVVVFSGVGMGIGFLLFGISNNPTVVIIGVLLSAGFGMSRPVLMRNYMQKYIPSEQRATTLSTASMIQKFILMIFNPVIGYLAEWNIYVVLLGLAFVAILWSIFTPVKESFLID